MKKLFSVLLSLNLIINPVVFAAEEITVNESDYVTSKGGFDFYLNQIVGLGNSIVGSTILSHCKLALTQTSMILFMGGSGIYIAKEMIGASQLGDHHKRKLRDLKITEEKIKRSGNMQYDILNERYEEEKKVQEMLKLRSILQGAVVVAYTAASIVAFMEKAKGITAPGSDYAGCYGGNKQSAKLATKLLINAYGSLSNRGMDLGIEGPTAGLVNTAVSAGANHFQKVFVPLLENYTEVSVETTKIQNEGIGRGVTFGVMAGLSAAVAAGLIHRTNLASRNAEEYKRVRDSLPNDNTDGITLSDTESGGNDAVNLAKEEIKNGKIDKLADGQKPKVMCFGKDGEYSESACKNKVSLPQAKWDVGMNMPELNKIGNMTRELYNELNGGDLGKAKLIAADLGSKAARLKQMQKNVVEELNKNLKAKGLETVDLDKKVAEGMQASTAGLQKMADSNNIKIPDDSSVASAHESKETPKQTVTAATQPAVGVPDTSPSFDLGDESETEVLSGDVATTENSLDDYESTVQDVAKNSDVSIFKQVSNRYLINYTKIFERKKLEAEPGE